MIHSDAELHGKSSFREWASLFSERLFVMIQVYADESEHGGATLIGGYIATTEYWSKFCRDWQKILNDFNAPYFHFREFAEKNHKNCKATPYDDWSERKKDKFLYELAFLASETAIPIGGGFGQSANEIPTAKDLIWKNSLVKLFEDLNLVLSEAWPNYTGKILFVFDKCQDRKKLIPIHEVHGSFSDKDSRFGGLAFEDDKDPKHLPLQAADLLAYVSRQQIGKMFSKEERQDPDARMLDLILLRKRQNNLKQIDTAHWKRFIKVVREHQIATTAEWKRKGIKKVYCPDTDFPWEKYGNKNRKTI